MNASDIKTQVTDLVSGTAGGYPLISLAAAAILVGIVMAVTPSKLKLLSFAYLLAVAALFATHAMHLLPAMLVIGAIWAVVMYPFRSTKKA